MACSNQNENLPESEFREILWWHFLHFKHLCWISAKSRNFILSKFYSFKVAADNWLFCLAITPRIDQIFYTCCCMLALIISFMGRKALNIMWRIFFDIVTLFQNFGYLFFSQFVQVINTIEPIVTRYSCFNCLCHVI